MPVDYVKLAQTYTKINPSRQQSYFAALTRFNGESTQTISSNWLKSEYLRNKLIEDRSFGTTIHPVKYRDGANLDRVTG
jgi:hypothetical protein